MGVCCGFSEDDRKDANIQQEVVTDYSRLQAMQVDNSRNTSLQRPLNLQRGSDQSTLKVVPTTKESVHEKLTEETHDQTAFEQARE